MYAKSIARGNALLPERSPVSSLYTQRHRGPAAVRNHINSQRGRHFVCHSADEDSSNLQTIPIFPLGIVALPSADIPLNIFEARYRVLFHTLIGEGKGIEPELVQEDSPFKGTKRFGVCYVSSQGLSKYGTVVEITTHSLQPDGRLLILNKGKERFRLQNVKQEKPVLLCEVEMLQDSCDEDTLEEQATKAKELFKNVVKLNARYRKVKIEDEHMSPPELEQLRPSQIAFWIASLFGNTPEGQQKVLEMNSPKERLEYVVDTLDESLKHTTAALAIDSVFASPSAEDSSDPDGEAGVKGKAEGESGKSKGTE